ncbi:MAG: phosphomannomutase, partial [Nevskiaceae bacterium]
KKIEGRYSNGAEIDRTDGISLEIDEGKEGAWRFNLRGSNTEPILRLNVESRGDEALMRKKTEELLALIDSA